MAAINLAPSPTRTARRKWTYEDYLALPDDGNRYEIIEGELYMVNAPGLSHQFAVFEIARQLGNFVIEHNLGYVLTAPFEVHLSEDTRPVQPDVLFIKTENWPGAEAKFYEGAPNLVVEVISPSSIRMDQHIKFSAYELVGVPEYWIVNPKTRSVEVLTLSSGEPLSGGEYALLGQFIEDEVIKSAVLTDLSIVSSSLFPPR